MAKLTFSRLRNGSEAVRFLESTQAHDAGVHEQLLDVLYDWDSDTKYVKFTNISICWFSSSLNTSMSVEELITEISVLLRTKPNLLYDFNNMLPQGYRIDCSIDQQVVDLMVVKTPSEIRIQDISWRHSSAPAPIVTNAEELRRVISSPDGGSGLLGLTSSRARCTLQLLQEVGVQNGDGASTMTFTTGIGR
jgi:hypothetical protein